MTETFLEKFYRLLDTDPVVKEKYFRRLDEINFEYQSRKIIKEKLLGNNKIIEK